MARPCASGSARRTGPGRSAAPGAGRRAAREPSPAGALAVEQDLPGRGSQQPAERSHDGGLAAAALPDQGQRLARARSKDRPSTARSAGAAALAELDGQVPYLQRAHLHTFRFPQGWPLAAELAGGRTDRGAGRDRAGDRRPARCAPGERSAAGLEGVARTGGRTGSRRWPGAGPAACRGCRAVRAARRACRGTSAAGRACRDARGPRRPARRGRTRRSCPAYMTARRVADLQQQGQVVGDEDDANPSSARSRSISSRISCCTTTSRAVVGSSMMTTSGSSASAIAMATRWRMPPDSSCGKLRTRPGSMSTISSSSRARRSIARPVHAAARGRRRCRGTACPRWSPG